MAFATIFTASLLMAFSGAIIPGSLFTVTIQESLRRGAKAGVQIAAGHAILELALVVAVIYGLGSFIGMAPVKGTIGVIGGAFLLWMAWGTLRDAFGKASFDLKAEAGKKGLHPLILGITVSGSNPYWLLWWATAGAGSLLIAADSGFLGIASFYIGHILADFIWYVFISISVAKGRKLFSRKAYRIILAACGIFLVALAGYFIWSGFGFWGLLGPFS